MFLHVTEPAAVLTRREGRLQVIADGARIADVGTQSLEAVVLWGANATVPALKLLLGREIPLILLDSRGRYRGRLEPAWSGHAALRDRQRECFRDRGTEFARQVVAGKLVNQSVVLERCARRGLTAVRPVARRLRRLAADALASTDREALRGIEGTGSREYFAAVGRALPGGFERSRRPPRDLVNAALSVAYGALLERVLAGVTAVGFDPYAGFYHGLKHGRPALALDLMEPLRPAMDRVIFGCARRRELLDAFAVRRDGACLLSPEGWEFVLGRVAEAFSRRATYAGASWPLAIVPIEQARSLARAVLGGTTFEPFRLPRD
jgi:CRISPR-associated endonuclease Cas1